MEVGLTTALLIGIAIFMVFMLLGMPIGLSMLLSGFIGEALIRGILPTLNFLGVSIFGVVNNLTLVTIPLFMFMGTLAAISGVSEDAFDSMNKWVGHLPGGLAMATIGTCSAFGAVCGHMVACSAAMIKTALPMMRKYGYVDEMSLGCIVSGGNLGVLIPPSVIIVAYCFSTNTPVGPQFIAGIIPGVLLTLIFWIQIYFQCRFNPRIAPKSQAVRWKERIIGTKGLLGIIVVFIMVLGGIYAGYFTPTEGGSVGVAAVFLLALMKRRLTWRGFSTSLLEAAEIAAVIILIIFGATIFSNFIAVSELNILLSSIVNGLHMSPYVTISIVLLFYIILGFFLDVMAILLVTLPITFPLVVNCAGFDPLLFGILCTLTIMIGCITPPVGLLVFAVHGMVPEVPVSTIFRGVWPYVVSMVVCLIILVAFPQITLFLPNLAMPYR